MDLTPAIINGTNPLINGPLSTNANTSYTSHYGGGSSKIKHQKNQSVVINKQTPIDLSISRGVGSFHS